MKNLIVVNPKDITFHPKNYNRHSEAQIEQLARSLDLFDQFKNIVCYSPPDDDALYVIAGEGLVRAALKRGLDEIAVNDRSDLSEDRAMALMLADNLLPSTDFDPEKTADLVRMIGDVEGVPGVTPEWLVEVLGKGKKKTKDIEPNIDEAENLREKWQTELGQNWQMGNHTLFIGSAESAGIECDFAIFDPPFNWAWQRQENALSWGIWKTALVMGLAQCMPLAVRDDFWHWWVWDAGMNRFGGRGHRPVTGCAMMILLGEHSWYEQAGLAALDRHGIEHFDWPTQVVHIQDHLAGREYKHEKPYPLTDYILSLYSKPGDIIGDLFAGSGAFLIACENLKRQYRGAELSPENAAVILDRWTRTFEVEPCLI